MKLLYLSSHSPHAYAAPVSTINSQVPSSDRANAVPSPYLSVKDSNPFYFNPLAGCCGYLAATRSCCLDIRCPVPLSLKQGRKLVRLSAIFVKKCRIRKGSSTARVAVDRHHAFTPPTPVLFSVLTAGRGRFHLSPSGYRKLSIYQSCTVQTSESS